jgi:ankyrin repeat protein
MCANSTRRISFESTKTVDLFPIVQNNSPLYQLDEKVVLDLHVHHVTVAEDYQLFDALKTANISLALELIDEHKGINSMDEYGQTPLMIAVSRQYQPIIAALLNTRRPKVDINLVKASGFSALFYAVEKANSGILQALLRRGADPNMAVTQEGSTGNTPLHYACLLEKVKHATMLLEYGANPYLQNEHGQIAYKMIPGDATASHKRAYRMIFDEAYKKIEQMEQQEGTQSQGEL